MYIRSRLLEVIALVLMLLVSVETLSAQSPNDDHYKFEVGGQFSLIKFGEQTAVNEIPYCLATCKVITEPFSDSTEPGFGGRFGYNLNRHLAIEAEINFFPRDHLYEGGRKLEGLFGVSAGKRFTKFGVFAKGRPGFLRLGKGDFRMRPALCPGDIPEPIGCFDPVAKTSFAFDAGGIVEYYPNKRLVVRFDAGDTILHFGERLAVTSVPALNPGVTIPFKIGLLGAPAETTHNFEGSIGVSFRF